MPSRRVVTGRSQEPRRPFAEELRLLRGARGESLRQVGERLGWDPSTFGKMESGESLGSPEIVEALDQHYGTPGLLLTLWELALADPSQFREQYRRYMVLEAEAVSLWHYAVSAPPGLLQTPGYAREALAAGGLLGTELNQQVEARMGRRKLLEGDKAPRSASFSRRRCYAPGCATQRSGGPSWSIWRRRRSGRTSNSRFCLSVLVPMA